MMKKIFLTMGMILALSLVTVAQDTTEVDIETSDVQLEMITPAVPVEDNEMDAKEREKKMREYYDDVAYAKASNSIRRGYFVLVADYIQIGKMGYRHYDINPNSNFVLVQGNDGIVQFAVNTGNPGSNGLGGWTAKGAVRNKRILEKDNGDIFIQYQLIGKVNTTVEITLYHNSNNAIARLMDGGEIIFYGQVLPYRDKKHR